MTSEKDDVPPATSNEVPNSGTNDTAISAPTLSDTGELELGKRSVRSVDQAYQICASAEKNNIQRAIRTRAISEIADMAPPRSLAANVQKAASYRDNFSTGFLAGVCMQVSIPIKANLAAAPFLTYSMLPPLWPESQKASDLLRAKLTDFCRDWKGFDPLCENVIQETVLQGYAYSAFLNPSGWKPTFFKQDAAFVPEGSSVDPTELQFLALKMDYPLQKFIALIEDEEAAAEQGYQLENCKLAAANSVVANPAGDAQTTQPRKYSDMVNEGVIGLTYSGTQPRQVETYLLFNVEYDGKVSVWLINRNLGKTDNGSAPPSEQRLLRFKYKAFDSFEDVANIFTFESGNGCVFSSKGVGRRLGNMAIALELARNEWMTNGRLSSLLIIVANSLQRSKLAPSVVGPFMVIDKEAGEFAQQKFESNSEGLLAIDKMLTAFAQQAAGAYTGKILSPNDNEPNETATAKKIDTAREQASSAWLVTRILNQIMEQVGMMQRHILTDDNIDRGIAMWKKLREDPTDLEPYSSFDTKEEKAAVCLVAEICQEWDASVFPVNWAVKASDKETGVIGTDLVAKTIKVWRDSPATPRSKTLETQRQQGLDAVAAQYGTNPNIDAVKLLSLRVENLIGPNLAKEVLIPQPDQTVTIEAARWQEMETAAMFALGLPVPVSVRDNHLVHATTVTQGLQQYAGPFLTQSGLNAPMPLLQAISHNVDHLGQHLAAMMQAGQSATPAYQQMNTFYKKFKDQFTQLLQIREQAKVATQVATAKHRGEMQASGVIGPDGGGQAPGQPGAVPPGAPGQAPAGAQGQPSEPPQTPQQVVRDNVTLNYKDLEPDVRAQVLQAIGLKPSANPAPSPDQVAAATAAQRQQSASGLPPGAPPAVASL